MNYPRDFTLQTDRCVLRHPSLADIPYICSAAHVPGFTDGMQWSPPLFQDDLIDPHEDNCKAWEEDRAYCFTIASLSSGVFLGRITIRKQEDSGVWDLGFFTHPNHYGNGYMTEAVREMMRFGFEQLGATQIVADHALWNKASEAVLKNNGMIFLEYISKGFMKNGSWVEENLLGITKSNWLEISQKT